MDPEHAGGACSAAAWCIAKLSGDEHWETLPPDADQASLLVNGNFIYYLADSVDYSAMRRRETFGERDELVSSSEFLDDEASLAVDENDLFWASKGSLYHVRIGKGTTPELVNRQFRYDADDYAGFILIDADYVYWQANVDGLQHDDDDPLPNRAHLPRRVESVTEGAKDEPRRIGDSCHAPFARRQNQQEEHDTRSHNDLRPEQGLANHVNSPRNRPRPFTLACNLRGRAARNTAP